MRVAGMIASLLVLIAVGVGLRFFADTVGIDWWLISQVLLPVILGVAALCIGLIYFGRWSVRKLNEADQASQRQGEGEEPRK